MEIIRIRVERSKYGGNVKIKDLLSKGGKYEKYEGVLRIRIRCHGRWMDHTKARKRKGGYSVPDNSIGLIFIYLDL